VITLNPEPIIFLNSRYPLLIILSLFLVNSCFSQQVNKISEKKGELSELRSEIKQLEDELNINIQKEKKSLKVIENYNRQKYILNKIINTIRKEEREKEELIIKIKAQITVIELRIKRLKENFSRYIVYLYKYGQEDELTMLLGSESFNQALLRYKYLNKISEQRKNELDDLKSSQKELDESQKNLLGELAQKKIIEDQKQTEEEELKQKIQKRKLYLASLKDDKEALKNEIDIKRKSEGEIKHLIEVLVAEEKRKSEILRKNKELSRIKNKSERKIDKIETKTENYEVEVSSNNDLRGKLLWPVDNGKIIRKFGEQKNLRLNTVTLNYGVDIKTSSGKSVVAVIDGVVSSINWLPGYGSIIIITHNGNFRTVYGHLSEIFVSEGTKVLTGSPIGTVEEDLEGNILHFEIWNERNNLNPELWLAKK
jgi:murein hydrolase activator